MDSGDYGWIRVSGVDTYVVRMGALGSYRWIQVSTDGFVCRSGYVHTLCRFACVRMDSGWGGDTCVVRMGAYGWIQ
jgi:hypothetical protein